MSKVIIKPIMLNPNEPLVVHFHKNGKFLTKKSGKDLLVFEEGNDVPVAVYENYELSILPVDLASLPHYAELSTAITGVTTDAVIGSGTAVTTSAAVAGTAAAATGTGLSTMAMVGLGGLGVTGAAAVAYNQLKAPDAKTTPDTTAPTVVIISSGLTNDPTPTLTGTAEAGSTVTVVIAGATYTTIATGGVWSIDTASALPTSGILSINVNGNNSISVTATDKAGNSTVAPATQMLELDTTAPDSIAPSGFMINDTGISITDGITLDPTLTLTLSGDTANWQYSLDNGTTWINGTGNMITLPEGTYDKQDVQVKQFDTAGNSSISEMSMIPYGMTIDITAPTATITPSDSALKIGETSTLTILFSEPVSAFDNSNLMIENGTLTAVTSNDGGTTWTATYTPTTNIEDTTNVISLSETYLDLAGNAGTVAQSANYIIDIIAPTATLTLSDSALKIGEISTLTVLFSEAVSAFDNSDLVIDNGTLTAVTSMDGGITWTAIYTPTSNIEDTTNVISLYGTYIDHAGNTGTVAQSANYLIDTLAPAVAITSPSLTNDLTPIVAGTAEADSTVTAVIAGATYVTIATSGVWSIDTGNATPTSGALSIDVNGNNSVSVTAVDSAGNPSASAATQNFSVDTTPPNSIASSAFVFTDTGISATDGISNNPTIALTLASDTDRWQYSLDNGTTWVNGVEDAISLVEGAYDKRNVQIKQFDAAGNSSISYMSTTPTLPTYNMVQLNAINGTYADKSKITSVGTTSEYVVTFSELHSAAVFVQKFNADGTTAGSMVQIDTGSSVDSPVITAVGTLGEYVVAINGKDSVGSDISIFVQKFKADGTIAGGMVNLVAYDRHNDTAYGQQVAALGTEGEYVVAFYAKDDGLDYSIYVQKFNFDGTIQGDMVKLEAIGNISGDDKSPQITSVGTAGEYVVTFYGIDSMGDISVFVQKFKSDGTTAGSMVQLEAIGNSAGNDVVPLVTAIGTIGEYVVTFWGIDSAGDYSVFVQKFNSDGTLIGSMVQLEAIGNITGTDYVTKIIATGSTGEFVVTFWGIDSEGDNSVSVQKFKYDGTTAGSMVQLEAIGNTTGADRYVLATAVGTTGEYIVTFQGTDNMGDESIFIQKFNVDGTIAGSMLQLEAIGVSNKDDRVPQITAVGTLGDYVVTFSGINSAGETSVFVQKFNADGSTAVDTHNTIVVDTTAPAVAITSSVLTNDATPIVSGTAEADSTVTAVITGATYVTIATGGIWSIDTGTAIPVSGTLSLDLNGNNSVLVTALDTAGNPSVSSAIQTLSVDTTAPSITSNTIAIAKDENSGAAQVIYTATATDASTVIYSLKNTGDYSFLSINATTGAVTLTASPDFETKPSYSFTVEATDTTGNASEKAVTLVINDLDEIAPTIIAPSGFVFTDTGISTHDGITSNSTITLSLAGDTVAWQYSFDGGSTWVNGLGNSISLSDGIYDKQNIQVKQFDLAGNSSISYMSTTPTVTPTMVQLEATGRTNGDDYAPQITAIGTTGAYVVTFQGVDSAGDDSIFVQKFNSDDTTAGVMVQLEAIGRTNGTDKTPQITAVGTAGEYVVTFSGIEVNAYGETSIFVQKFNADGTIAGSMVKLEASVRTDGYDEVPQITAVGTVGEFVVTFEGQSNGFDQAIYIQKFNASGAPVGAMVKQDAIANASGYDASAQITSVGTSGEYVLTFYGRDSTDLSPYVNDYSIYIRKFNADGTIGGPMVQLEAISKTNGDDKAPQITSVGTIGEYVVTFQGADSAGDNSIFVQKFNANSTTAGSMVQLEAIGIANNDDGAPQITAVGTAGEYVVAFHGVASTGNYSIFVQKFNANGTIAGSMVKLEAIDRTDGGDGYPQIAAVGTAGEYVVTFNGLDSAGDGSVFVQKFNADGTIAGAMVQLEAIGVTNNDDGSPQVTAVGTTGEYIVTFTAVDNTGDYSVFVQKFNADGTITVDTHNTLIVDTTAPMVVITSPDQSKDPTPIVTGTSQADSVVTVVIAGATYTTISTGGVWSIDTASAIPTSGTLGININGNNSVSVTAIDSAGNSSSYAATQVLSVAVAINLSSIEAGVGGFIINGQSISDNSGISVSNAGDVNGDGLGDLIVGASAADPAGITSAGKSYVVFGKTGTTAINLSSVEAGVGGFVINGQSASDYSGNSVSSAGDVNGDGLDDLIVGAYAADPAGITSAGKSYVVFGKTGTTAINLSSLEAGVDGFVINGQSASDLSGVSVSSAGDVNGDGYDDLIVGAYGADTLAGLNAGKSYVVFGKTGTTAINLSSVEAGVGGFVINGQSAEDLSGYSVSNAGDVNGDGYDDLIVGAYQASSNAGKSYVVFGKTDTTAINLSAIETGTGGFVITGQSANNRSGYSVSNAGDVNGDGLDDLIVGARDAGIAGKSYVVFGKTTGTAINLSAIETGTGGFVINGQSSGDHSGISVTSAGDVNGDGLDDLIVGAQYATNDAGALNAGKSYVVFGQTSGMAINLSSVEEGVGGFVINGQSTSNYSGSSVSYAGDVNGDGYDDLIVGAFFANSSGGIAAGKSYVIFGGDYTQRVVDYLGDTTDNTLAGTIANEQFIGGAGNDSLIGNGGKDVMYGGSGNDSIILNASNVAALSDNNNTASNIMRVDGGSGTDTLIFDGSGISLDFTAISGNKITDIENIDIYGNGNNSLKLTYTDLLHLNDSNTLVVAGGFGSSVTIVGATAVGTVVLYNEAGNYYSNFNSYNMGGTAAADIWIAYGVSVITA